MVVYFVVKNGEEMSDQYLMARSRILYEALGQCRWNDEVTVVQHPEFAPNQQER